MTYIGKVPPIQTDGMYNQSKHIWNENYLDWIPPTFKIITSCSPCTRKQHRIGLLNFIEHLRLADDVFDVSGAVGQTVSGHSTTTAIRGKPEHGYFHVDPKRLPRLHILEIKPVEI